MWKDLFLSAVDQTVPKLRWTRRKVKHWFSQGTITLIHNKRKLYKSMKASPSPTVSTKYRYISNLVRSKTRAETKNRALSFSGCFRLRSSGSGLTQSSVITLPYLHFLMEPLL